MLKNEKFETINEFFKRWVEILENNPDFVLTQDVIYHDLITKDISKADKKVDLSNQVSKTEPELEENPSAISPLCNPQSTFNNWIQMYSKSKRTECFMDKTNSYSIIFVSKDNKARTANVHIKIYIPLDADHIENGVKMIFDFIEKNKISHISKVGKKIRFDDLSIRVVNQGDADKILDFVKINPYLQEGLIKPNPFAFQKDNIALAVDGLVSYNETVATLLYNYLNECKNSNGLKYADATDFYNYVTELYKKQFVTNEDTALKDIIKWNDEQEEDYKGVISLILKVRSDVFTFNEFIDHYKESVHINKEELKIKNDVDNLLLEALKAMTERFNTNGTQNVEAYFYTGDTSCVTSRNGLRARLEESGFRKKLRKILSDENLTFIEYAKQLLQKNNVVLEDLIVNNKEK